MQRLVDASIGGVLRALALAIALNAAVDIRLYAVKEYGRIIHEFDPWFNFRATQYLADNGWKKFSTWFDYMSWYPLGRPVGTTIYPGMQITAVFLWRTLNAIGVKMSLNDVCVFFPAWFGAIATFLTALLTKECSGSGTAAVVAALVMSIVPAHTMRSVAGGYDNESLAVTAMCLTFYVWCRALRTPDSWWIGALAGLAYSYMVAAWGGYTFVLNMVGLHAAVLVIYKRYSSSLHKAYSLFFVVGTIGALQFPVVGTLPFTSAEQLGPMFVFLGFQVLEFTERTMAPGLSPREKWQRRFQMYAYAAVAAIGALVLATTTGVYNINGLSVRVKSLFIKHTKTGNPLVDSVAEHQPGTSDSYYRFLHFNYFVAPVGFVFSVVHFLFDGSAGAMFLPLYGLVAYYFSNRMVRLIIFLGPVAACLVGVCVGYVIEDMLRVMRYVDPEEEKPKAAEMSKSAKKKAAQKNAEILTFKSLKRDIGKHWNNSTVRNVRLVVSALSLTLMSTKIPTFYEYSHSMAQGMSQPSIMFKGQLRDGSTIMVRDYVDAYEWLKKETPEDARVMAWWDYGYQITGIGNRTSIADGNTWNHEHIANLARMLTSEEEKAHKVIRHLADYVLVWAGGGGDDMAKSPHLFRIGASIGSGRSKAVDMSKITSTFGVDQYGRPTPKMASSLLFKLVSPQGQVSPERFKEVFTSRYGKVRIYKVVNVDEDSKAWVANPANRMCDHSDGSGFCPGAYPPALKQFPKIIKPAYKVPEWIKEKRSAERAAAGSSKDEL
jgi:dolichyl-diphosphooligosaccharide--protein glycosyltransferase